MFMRVQCALCICCTFVLLLLLFSQIVLWNAIRIRSTTRPKEHRDRRVGYDDDDDGNYAIIAVFVELYKVATFCETGNV